MASSLQNYYKIKHKNKKMSQSNEEYILSLLGCMSEENKKKLQDGRSEEEHKADIKTECNELTVNAVLLAAKEAKAKETPIPNDLNLI